MAVSEQLRKAHEAVHEGWNRLREARGHLVQVERKRLEELADGVNNSKTLAEVETAEREVKEQQGVLGILSQRHREAIKEHYQAIANRNREEFHESQKAQERLAAEESKLTKALNEVRLKIRDNDETLYRTMFLTAADSGAKSIEGTVEEILHFGPLIGIDPLSLESVLKDLEQQVSKIGLRDDYGRAARVIVKNDKRYLPGLGTLYIEFDRSTGLITGSRILQVAEVPAA